MIDGGIFAPGATLGRLLRWDSGESCRARAWAAADGGLRPGCGMPRRDAMSLASEGEDSRAALPNLAAANADVVGFALGVADVVVGEAGFATLSADAKSCRDTLTSSALASAVAFSTASGTSCALIMFASLACSFSSSFRIRSASESPVLFAARA